MEPQHTYHTPLARTIKHARGLRGYIQICINVYGVGVLFDSRWLSCACAYSHCDELHMFCDIGSAAGAAAGGGGGGATGGTTRLETNVVGGGPFTCTFCCRCWCSCMFGRCIIGVWFVGVCRLAWTPTAALTVELTVFGVNVRFTLECEVVFEDECM